MFRFANPDYLFLLYLLPLFAAVLWIAEFLTKRSLLKFAQSGMHRSLFSNRSILKPWIKGLFLLFAFSFIVIALANPQIGTKAEDVKQSGIDVMIVLDVSLSMKAEDIKPSRLEKAKYEIGKLIEKLQGDRIGLIVFSGEAYVQFPLTTDYAAANLLLSAVDVSSVPVPGTALSAALETAGKSFKKDIPTNKAIILITDGEDHEGSAVETASRLNSEGIKIYSVGVGSPGGVPIPVYDSRGNNIGFKKDLYGNTVLTKLNEEILSEIVSAGNGKYFRASGSLSELDKIYTELSGITKTEFGTTRIITYEDRFYFFLFPAFLLIVIELFISGIRSKVFIKMEKDLSDD